MGKRPGRQTTVVPDQGLAATPGSRPLQPGADRARAFYYPGWGGWRYPGYGYGYPGYGYGYPGYAWTYPGYSAGGYAYPYAAPAAHVTAAAPAAGSGK